MKTIITKDIGVEVKDKFLPYAEVSKEAMHEQDYIKRELRCEDGESN